LEEIERSQIRQSEAAGAGVVSSLQDKPLFHQISATASSVSHSKMSDQLESPNTVLRRTLNIAPPPPADTGQQPSLVGSHLNTFQPVVAAQPDSAASTRKSSDNSTTVLSSAANVESSDRLYADVASSLSSTGLITPQALLQTHFSTKVS